MFAFDDASMCILDNEILSELGHYPIDSLGPDNIHDATRRADVPRLIRRNAWTAPQVKAL